MTIKVKLNFFFVIYILLSGVSFGGHVFEWREQMDAVQSFIDIGEFLEAEKTCKVLLNVLENEEIFLLELLGNISYKQKRFRCAADYYLRASKASGSEGKRFRYLIISADAYYKNKDFNISSAIYKDCYNREKNEEVLFRYGCALLHGGKIEEAELIKFSNERLQAKFDWNCAAYWNFLGELERASRYLIRWIEKGISDGKYYNIYAQMQYRLGNFDKVLGVIRLAEGIGNKIGEGVMGDLKLLRMRVGSRTGNEVKEEKGSMEGGDSKRYIMWKSLGLIEGEHWESYDNIGERLREECGRDGIYIIGEAEEARGRYEESIKRFREASEDGGRIGYISLYREGEMEYRIGNVHSAIVMYENLIEGIEEQSWMKDKGGVRRYLQEKVLRMKSSR